MPPISVCVIAKNEEANIARCLESLKPYGFEVILVDTGSSDRTKEIALEYGAKVYDFAWVSDFSAARNFAVSKAANNWVLAIDCDEYITHINLPEIYSLMKQYPRCVGVLEIENEMQGSGNSYTARLVRFFSRKHFHFTGAIHEQVMPLGKEEDIYSFDVPIKLYHTGYVGSEEQIAAKNKRNFDMLLAAVEKEPNDAYNYYQIAQSYVLGDNCEKACEWYSKALSFDIDPDLDYVKTMIVSYGQSLLTLGRKEEALNFVGIYDAFSHLTDFVYLMGRIYEANNQEVKALGEFLKAITMPAGMQAGVNSFLPCYRIAVIYDNMNNMEIALMYYKKCGDFAPAKSRLDELYG
ncbi:MAG: glycosyltransferase family 2 protein [Lachnospiraceae bacterium]|nr:glycosyltransferase family 2 protein [Lachnospiraceae bacterium]